MTTEQFANDLAILFLQFERDVIATSKDLKQNYTDNDFSFENFMHWVKSK